MGLVHRAPQHQPFCGGKLRRQSLQGRLFAARQGQIEFGGRRIPPEQFVLKKVALFEMDEFDTALGPTR